MKIRETEYSIVPDPALMEDIGATSFTVAEAIVELVANSIDARIPGGALRIDVQVSPDEIRVVDDASGMKEEILAEAVRLGVKMDAVTGRTDERKGMFGLGMKTACASLGRYWAITTRPMGAKSELFVEFDLAKWREQTGSRNPSWKATIEERESDRSGPLVERNHGTAVIVRNLRDRSPMPGAVLKALGAAYKPHLEQGDVIAVNGDPAMPPAYDLLDGSKVTIDEPCGKHRISGWVGLDKRTHNDDFFGLNLYRKKQLLVAWDKSWFAVHLMTSRIVGEVNLDFVPPNFHKKGFETQSPEWKLASATMREILRPVVQASRTASRGRTDQTRFVRAVQGLQRAMGKQVEVSIAVSPDGSVESTTPAIMSAAAEIRVEANVLYLPSGPVNVSHVLKDLEDDQLPWSYMWDDQRRELQAVVNSGSRLFAKTLDTDFLMVLALADCVAQFLTIDMGFDAGTARRFRDRWLYVAIEDKR